ncbi:MAG: ribonuclease R [Bacillota bacterium]
MKKKKKELQELLNHEYRPSAADWFLARCSGNKKDVLAELEQLVQEGKLIIKKTGSRKQYYLPKQLGYDRGILHQSGKGYAFLLRENEEDIFIPAHCVRGAWHGDTVLVERRKTSAHRRKKGRGKRREGCVIRIVARNTERLVGTYQNGFVYPDDRRLIEPVFVGKVAAQSGDKVVVQMVFWPQDGKKNPKGQILEVFAHKDDKNLETLSVIKNYDLPYKFSRQVLQEAKQRAVLSAEDKAGRRDFREDILLTIDGADAKDLDDAVSLQKLANNNWLLGVHIADVAHYVRANSPLDREAALRGTSVYLPDLVIPMLPPDLSNHICSLNAGADRLAMSCLMEIDPTGAVVASEICESVINVKKRLSYEEINAALMQHDPVARENLGDYLKVLSEMAALQKTLRQRRRQAGAIDFNFPETKIIMEEGEVIDIVAREHGLSERIIEEMMLCANRTVAETYFAAEAPFVYRVHEAFPLEDLPEINEFLAPLGYVINHKGGQLHPRAIQKVLQEAAGTPEERILSLLLLRAMNHARYSTTALGHFALAMPYYSHFTAPIRRYPDILIHRVIKAYLAKGSLKSETKETWRRQMEEHAQDSSYKERRAEEVERRIKKIKCCHFMKQKIGQVFSGHISGVTGYGMYVELENSVEGLVRLSNLTDDYYEHDEKKFTLTGVKCGKIYRLGDLVKIQVLSVDEENMFIDFLLAHES